MSSLCSTKKPLHTKKATNGLYNPTYVEAFLLSFLYIYVDMYFERLLWLPSGT